MLTVHVFNPIPGQVCPLLRIFTDRVRSTREGYVLTHSPLDLARGYPDPWVPHLGVFSLVGPGGGHPDQGVPHLRYSRWTWLGGTPTRGVPHLRYPLGPGQGVIQPGVRYPDLGGGVPHLRYPPSPRQTWPGGVP